MTDIRAALQALADPEKAAFFPNFFRTGPGEYGEGDRFMGVTVPRIRGLVKQQRDLPLPELLRCLESPWHEERLFALLAMVDRFRRGEQHAVYTAYVQHIDRVNNWDLVDCSAPYIVGPWLETRSRRVLYTWSRSRSLWRRRIAVLATFHFIRQGDFADILALSERLLEDPEDLIHKAVGWMLREVGNRDRKVEEAFLLQHYQAMPRTMLRYAIEKFPEPRRQAYLKGTV